MTWKLIFEIACLVLGYRCCIALIDGFFGVRKIAKRKQFYINLLIQVLPVAKNKEDTLARFKTAVEAAKGKDV